MKAKRLLVGATVCCLALLCAGPSATADEAAPQPAGTEPACQSLEAPGVPAVLQLSGTVCGNCVFTSPGCEGIVPGGACKDNSTKTCRIVLPAMFCFHEEVDIVKCACV